MTGQQLRNSILQEAIQGRLVPNVLKSGEKTGAELLQQILKERQDRENKEKGKKAKKLTLSTIEEEPWELPEGWCWTQIGDIFDHSAGKSLNSSKQSIGKVYPYLTTSNVYWDGITFEKVKEMAFTEEEYKKCSAIKNDILVCEGGDVGRSCIWTYDYTIGLQNHVHRLRAIKNVDVNFFYYVLRFYKANGIITAKGIGIGGFSANALKGLTVPLPPLSIQKAIVEKIEDLLPLVDEYDKAAGELEILNKVLPDKLRKSVLQEAIHGTLVPNDIPEGEATAPELLRHILKERQERENKEKGKKAKKIILSTIDEEPWELPEGWCWCRLGDLGEFSRGNGIKKDEVIPEGYPCVRYGELYTRYRIQFSTIASHVNESVYRRSQKIERGDVVMALTGENEYDIALASVYLGTEPVAMGGDMTKLHPYVDSKFLVYTINSPHGIECKSLLATGQIIVHISNDKLASIPIPLPPLSIQHRIVEKIEEVFSVIDKLTASKDSE